MAKKDFKTGNPALQFISSASAPKQQDNALPVEKDLDGHKFNPVYLETKSKRMQLVIQPSLYEKVKNAAHAKGISINEFVHRTLYEATKDL